MPDDAFVPCREWLGIEPDDLATPHRLLGLGEDEADPLAIVRAADRRMTTLRNVPAELAAERDAVMAQVEAARDAMLAAAVSARSAAAPPPVPPPPGPAVPMPPPVPPAVSPAAGRAATSAVVPPPVPPAATSVPTADVPGTSDDAILVSRSRVAPRGRSNGAGMALGLTALVIAGGAVAAYVAWPHLQHATTVARRPDHRQQPATPHPQPSEPRPESQPQRKPVPESRPSPESQRAPEPKPTPQPAPQPNPAPAPRPEPEPQPEPQRQPTPAPQPPPGPMNEPAPDTPSVDPAKVRAAIGAAIGKGFESLRRQDFAAARREFDAVADQALDDQQATDRLHRWRQLLLYAEQYPGYRDKALASAASTAATYDFGSRQIAVVEFTPREFIYRDSRRPGRNLKVPRDSIPPDVEQGLVESWFAKDGRAANHLFLGAAAVSRREPDLAVARREWRAAADGGEPHGELLLGILDDPVVRGR